MEQIYSASSYWTLKGKHSVEVGNATGLVKAPELVKHAVEVG
jgi:hypothetical protein